MNGIVNRIKDILANGESICVEFKESKTELNKDVYETVCAFLNRHGGDIILGAEDDGTIIGVDSNKIVKIKKEFVTQVNNPNKINPPVYLSIEEIEIDNRVILHIYVPESSQVYRCSNKIFDRNEDGDFEITNNTNLVADLYSRKQRTYSENKIYPIITLDDLRTDIIKRIRKLATNQKVNHLESYDRLMAFIEKHLKDKFYLEKEQRISLRNHIFREVISNILIHREYMNPFPAKLIIEVDKVITENSNKPHRHGVINPENFSPFPKNPIIAKVFKEIGWVDELGSGVRNIYKYSKYYSGQEPLLIEEDVFKIIIPITPQVTPQVTPQDGDRSRIILEFCKEPKSRDEIQELLGLKDRKHFMKNILQPLIDTGQIKLTLPDKPRSPKQKYFSY